MGVNSIERLEIWSVWRECGERKREREEEVGLDSEFLTAEGFRQRSSMLHAFLSNVHAQVRFEMSVGGGSGGG